MVAPMRLSSRSGSTGTSATSLSGAPSTGQKPASAGNKRWHFGHAFTDQLGTPVGDGRSPALSTASSPSAAPTVAAAAAGSVEAGGSYQMMRWQLGHSPNWVRDKRLWNSIGGSC